MYLGMIAVMMFVALSMWQYHQKIQNEYFLDDAERRILFPQTIALSVLLLTFVLSAGFTLTESHPVNPAIWVWLMCLMLVFIGASSIKNKVSVVRRRMHQPPKGNEAVFWGIILIILAVVLVVKYYQCSYAFLPLFGECS
ncbi:MAG: hypothetical protein H6658_06105 [Ardenticatenaceae bacterium]|nr:hypothetical protein [Ardenticatenaceae bacterium]